MAVFQLLQAVLNLPYLLVQKPFLPVAGYGDALKLRVAELEEKGLIKKYTRRNYDGNYIANGYHIAPMKGKWFLFPSTKQVFALSKAEFGVFLYLCKCRNKKGRAFPSFTAIAEVLKVARNTVIEAIAGLVQGLFITKGEKRPGKHNLYTVNNGAQEQQPPTKKAQKNSTVGKLCYQLDGVHPENYHTNNFLAFIVAKGKELVKGIGRAGDFLKRVVQKL